jgi:hypothetical protein
VVLLARLQLSYDKDLVPHQFKVATMSKKQQALRM